MRRLWRMGVALVAIAALGAMVAGGAWGEARHVLCQSHKDCDETKALHRRVDRQDVYRRFSETHEGKYEKIKPSALSEVEEEKLKKLLAHMNYEEAGVGGKPTVQFHDSNVQVVNGEGKTESTNGEGNLVIGYDEHEESEAQTGSHDLVLGINQEFTSFGSLVVGRFNRAIGEWSSVTGGASNTASGYRRR